MMKISNSSTKAKRKYNAENYSQLNVQLKSDVIKNFKLYCKNSNIPQRAFIEQAIMEKIERDTGKSFDEFLKEQQQEQEPEEPKDTKEPKSPERPEVFKLDQ